jgi:hypothetical protein
MTVYPESFRSWIASFHSHRSVPSIEAVGGRKLTDSDRRSSTPHEEGSSSRYGAGGLGEVVTHVQRLNSSV